MTYPPTLPIRQAYTFKARTRTRDIAMVITLGLTAILISLFATTEVTDWFAYTLVRLLSLLPVVSIAYFYGVIPGLAVAFLFTGVYIAEILFAISEYGFSLNSIELTGLSLLLIIVALVTGDISTSFRQRSGLRAEIEVRELLLSRTLNLDEVTFTLIEQIQRVIRIWNAYFILRSPISGQWQIYSILGQTALGNNTQNYSTELGEWLLQHKDPIILNNLDAPDSILFQDPKDPYPIHSIATCVLRHSNGMDMGRLVMVNKLSGYFSSADQTHVAGLVKVGENAIEHAYQFTRTDYALERQLSQLSTIQKASQQLNATLEPEKAVDLTLSVALEITQAEAGVILLDIKDLIKLLRTRGNEKSSELLKEKIEKVFAEGSVNNLKPQDLNLPFLFNSSESQLVAFIRHRSSLLGLIVVESPRMDAFNQTTEWILSLLADHTAVALANSRLFQEIFKEKQQNALIIQSVTDGLITVNSQGVVLTANPAAQTQIGLPEAKITGQPLYTIMGWDDQAHQKFDQSLHTAWNQQTPFKIEMQSISPLTSKRKVVNLSAAPIYDYGHESSQMVILIHDLTEKEELSRLQEELISSMSHEMRTPLTKIRSISDYISSQLNIQNNPSFERYLDTLNTESERLSHFLDRILDVHELETREFEVELRPLPLTYVINNLIEEWRMVASERTIHLTQPDTPAWVIADENGLNSVLNNLLDNAIKYSPADTPVEVHLKISDDSSVIISVTDYGIGIAPEYKDAIFERFYRVSGEDAQTVYGHGIGLYVARLLIQEMGGKIWVESAPNQGSCFSFSLPLQEEVTNETKDHHSR